MSGVGARALRPLLLVAGAYHLALGLWMAIDPGSFYDALATFPPRNDHFLHDVSTFYLAFGATLLVAARDPRWRVPVLALGTLQYALHVVSHIVDVGDAETDRVGISAIVGLAVVTAILASMLREARANPER